MPFQAPYTSWLAGDPVLETDMNRIEGNIEALKNPPSDSYVLTGGDYTTNSTSFVDVDTTNINFTLATTGGAVEFGFHSSVSNNTQGSNVYFNLLVDGSPLAADNGIFQVGQDASFDIYPVSFVRRIEGLGIGSHTFKLQWKVTGNTGRIYANTFHGQVWVREVN